MFIRDTMVPYVLLHPNLLLTRIEYCECHAWGLHISIWLLAMAGTMHLAAKIYICGSSVTNAVKTNLGDKVC